MSDLNELYQEVILDHSRSPHNYGPLSDANRHAKGYNPLCGDQVEIFARVDGNKIADIRFVGSGCAISKSSASVMTEVVKGKTPSEAQTLFERFRHLITDGPSAEPDAEEKLNVFAGVHAFPTRVKCAALAWHALKSALENKEEKNA